MAGQKKITIRVTGMVCGGCEDAVERALGKREGIQQVHADHVAERVTITVDPDLIDRETIADAINEAGFIAHDPDPGPYQSEAPIATSPPASPEPVHGHRLRNLFLFVVLLVVIGGIVQWGRSMMPDIMMQLNAGIGYTTLFLIGFLTGFHCIGMCGSFVVSYASRTHSLRQSVFSHAAYGSGKTLSYTTFGALFGLAGALITVTPALRGYAAIFAGLFLLLFGLKMLNIIPAMRLLNPRFPRAVTKKVTGTLERTRHPFVIGWLNGLLLGCGPLQAMYILAAGTGSATEGALMLFLFGLGTLPPLLGFGFFASYLSQASIHQIVRVSGVLVIIMGALMLDRGAGMLMAA
ncbi:MAG: sulfite exporter TauE/SafE family protein [Pseudomonadota bacterium]